MRNKTNMTPRLLLSLVLLLLVGSTASAKKVKRVRAGKHYKQHDAVHLVVNKVG